MTGAGSAPPGEVETWPEFWLGSRTESSATDFDGHVRRCRPLARRRTTEAREVLLAAVDPPLPGQARDTAVAVRLHRPSDSWDDMAHRWLMARVGLVDAATVARLQTAPGEPLRPDEITPLGWGEVAATPELLPPTPEQLWEEAFSALQRFVVREGHARVPLEHEEDGLGLGTWVANQRVKYAHEYLSGEEAARLEALPGWEW